MLCVCVRACGLLLYRAATSVTTAIQYAAVWGSIVGYAAKMGAGASKTHPEVSSAKYAAEQVRNTPTEDLADAFAQVPDAERQRVMAALGSANLSADYTEHRSFRNFPACWSRSEHVTSKPCDIELLLLVQSCLARNFWQRFIPLHYDRK